MPQPSPARTKAAAPRPTRTKTPSGPPPEKQIPRETISEVIRLCIELNRDTLQELAKY